MTNLKEQVGIKGGICDGRDDCWAGYWFDGILFRAGDWSPGCGRGLADHRRNDLSCYGRTSCVPWDSLKISTKSNMDLTVDGADEVDGDFNGIKGGGAALLMEKVVAVNSKDCIWIVDESKVVQTLGAFKLPVEVVQYGAENLFRLFEKKGIVQVSVCVMAKNISRICKTLSSTLICVE